MNDIIKLNIVVYNKKARGEWCALPYPGHRKGCPNIKKCISDRSDFKEDGYIDDIENMHMQWYAVIERFNLGSHAAKMRLKHPYWTKRQCRNLLYWQGGVKKRLREKALAFAEIGDTILDIPEATGIDIFATMEKHGIELEKHQPMNIIKIMFVGKYIKED